MAPAQDRDPYEVLGVDPSASDEQVRAAYHRLVQLHHPDHNGGSADAARRFEEVQAAYASVKKLRASSSPSASETPRREPARASSAGTATDPDLEARLAKMERDLREAHLARERARQAAREAAAKASPRPSDEELGYVRTDDSFSKILDDAVDELSGRLADARHKASDEVAETSKRPAAKRIGDVIDELAARLTGESPPRTRQ